MYIGEKIKPQKGKILNNLKKLKPSFSTYVIVLDFREKQIEIYHNIIFINICKTQKSNRFIIIGIAANKQEAFRLVRDIVQDIYKVGVGLDFSRLSGLEVK